MNFNEAIEAQGAQLWHMWWSSLCSVVVIWTWRSWQLTEHPLCDKTREGRNEKIISSLISLARVIPRYVLSRTACSDVSAFGERHALSRGTELGSLWLEMVVTSLTILVDFPTPGYAYEWIIANTNVRPVFYRAEFKHRSCIKLRPNCHTKSYKRTQNSQYHSEDNVGLKYVQEFFVRQFYWKTAGRIIFPERPPVRSISF